MRCVPSSPNRPPIYTYRRISPKRPNHIKHLSSSLSLQSSAPYQSLKSIWLGSESDSRPHLSPLLAGSNFIFTSPTPRQKSEELKARLRKLEEAAERKAYDELVKDITPMKHVNEPFLLIRIN